nr:RNA-directed DNA polymerase, eukaryota [Tanacetum cinerariifolium]
INLKKSHLLGVGVSNDLISHAAGLLGCGVLKPPFKYLGIIVGGSMSKVNAWDDSIDKIKAGLSKWKLSTLSIGGRLTLLKALLFKWVWRFISHDGSLWFRLINAMHGNNLQVSSSCYYSPWKVILKEVSVLKSRGVDLLGHCKIRVGSDMLFLVETQQFEQLQMLVDTVILSNVDDRWFWDLNGKGVFCVKDARNLIDETFPPKEPIATRWLKIVPIKVNIFAWKLHHDRLPTRANLVRRGMLLALFVGGGIFLGCKL